MNRIDQRKVLEAFSRDLNREMHNLQDRPELLWQQMCNRLQWEGKQGEAHPVAEAVQPELTRRTSLLELLWPHVLTKPKESKELLRTFVNPSAITCCVFMPGGEMIATGDQEGVITVWEADTGKMRNSWHGHNTSVISLSSDYTSKLVSMGSDNCWISWDCDTAQPIACSSREKERFLDIALSPCGLHAAAAIVVDSDALNFKCVLENWEIGKEAVQRLTEYEIGHPIRGGPNEQRWVWRKVALCISKGGELIATNTEGVIAVWRTSTSERLWSEGSYNEGNNLFLAFSPDGSCLFAGSHEGSAKLWDARTGELLTTLSAQPGLKTASFSGNGTHLASWDADGAIRILDLSTGDEVATLLGHAASIGACAFSTDGRFLASGDTSGRLLLWETDEITASTRAAEAQPPEAAIGHQGVVDRCFYSSDGLMVASEGADGIKVWETTAGAVSEISVAGDGLPDKWGAFAGDGPHVFVVGEEGRPVLGPRKALFLMPVTDRKAHRIPGGHPVADYSEYSRNLRMHVSGRRGESFEVWDSRNGVKLCWGSFRYEEDVGVQFLLSSDSRALLVDGSNKVLELWDIQPEAAVSVEGDTGFDIEQRRVVATFGSNPRGVEACAFSNDGKLLATPGFRNRLDIYSLDNAERIASLPGRRSRSSGHRGTVQACSFSPDARLLAAADEGGAVRIWDIKSQGEVAVLAGGNTGIEWCAFSKSGNRIVTVDEKRQLVVWGWESGDVIATITGVKSNEFTPGGGFLALVSDQSEGLSLRFCEIESGDLSSRYENTLYAVSSDDSHLLTVDTSHLLVVRELKSGTVILSLPSAGRVTCCAFSPLGNAFCYGDTGGNLGIVEVVGFDPLPLTPLLPPAEPVVPLPFSDKRKLKSKRRTIIEASIQLFFLDIRTKLKS